MAPTNSITGIPSYAPPDPTKNFAQFRKRIAPTLDRSIVSLPTVPIPQETQSFKEWLGSNLGATSDAEAEEYFNTGKIKTQEYWKNQSKGKQNWADAPVFGSLSEHAKRLDQIEGPATSSLGKVRRGVRTAVGEMVDMGTSPKGLAALGAITAATAFPPGLVLLLAKTGLTSAGIVGLAETYPQIKDAWEAGDTEEVSRLATHATAAVGMVAGGLTMKGGGSSTNLKGEEGFLDVSYLDKEGRNIAKQGVEGMRIIPTGEITPRGKVPGATMAEVRMTAPPIGNPTHEASTAMKAIEASGVPLKGENVQLLGPEGTPISVAEFSETYPTQRAGQNQQLSKLAHTKTGAMSFSSRAKIPQKTAEWDKYTQEALMSTHYKPKSVVSTPLPETPPIAPVVPTPAAPVTPAASAATPTPKPPMRTSEMLRQLEDMFPDLPVETHMEMLRLAQGRGGDVSARPAAIPTPTPTAAAPPVEVPPVVAPPAAVIPPVEKPPIVPPVEVKPIEAPPVEKPPQGAKPLVENEPKIEVNGEFFPYTDIDGLRQALSEDAHITFRSGRTKGTLIYYDDESGAFGFLPENYKGTPDDPLPLINIEKFLSKGPQTHRAKAYSEQFRTVADEHIAVPNTAPLKDTFVLHDGSGTVVKTGETVLSRKQVDMLIKSLEEAKAKGDPEAAYELQQVLKSRNSAGGLTRHKVVLSRDYEATRLKKPQDVQEGPLNQSYNSDILNKLMSEQFMGKLKAKGETLIRSLNDALMSKDTKAAQRIEQQLNRIRAIISKRAYEPPKRSSVEMGSPKLRKQADYLADWYAWLGELRKEGWTAPPETVAKLKKEGVEIPENLVEKMSAGHMSVPKSMKPPESMAKEFEVYPSEAEPAAKNVNTKGMQASRQLHPRTAAELEAAASKMTGPGPKKPMGTEFISVPERFKMLKDVEGNWTGEYATRQTKSGPKRIVEPAHQEFRGKDDLAEFDQYRNIDQWIPPEGVELPTPTMIPAAKWLGPTPMSTEGGVTEWGLKASKRPAGPASPRPQLTTESLSKLRADLKVWEAAEKRTGSRIKQAEALRNTIKRIEGFAPSIPPRPPSSPTTSKILSDWVSEHVPDIRKALKARAENKASGKVGTPSETLHSDPMVRKWADIKAQTYEISDELSNLTTELIGERGVPATRQNARTQILETRIKELGDQQRKLEKQAAEIEGAASRQQDTHSATVVKFPSPPPRPR
jgi:hypothetical protein